MSTLEPVTGDHDHLSDTVRRYSAERFKELIDSLRPHVAEILADPAGIHDTEPGRIAAYTSLVKLYTSVVKELGALYQVTQRPPERVDPNLVPMEQVEAMLLRERELHALELKLAVDAAAEQARTEAAVREQLTLEAARTRVVERLRGLQ